MTVGFPDGTARQIHDTLRLKVIAAECDYRDQRTPESRRRYMKALKQFADLVLRDQLPKYDSA